MATLLLRNFSNQSCQAATKQCTMNRQLFCTLISPTCQMYFPPAFLSSVLTWAQKPHYKYIHTYIYTVYIYMAARIQFRARASILCSADFRSFKPESALVDVAQPQWPTPPVPQGYHLEVVEARVQASIPTGSESSRRTKECHPLLKPFKLLHHLYR